MTIDEAIKHCEEVAEQNEFETRIYDELNRQGDGEYRNNHCQCAADHRQLAEWLTELKELKAAGAQINKSQWQPPLMGQGKCETYCDRCFGKIMRNSTGIFEETPFCPHCGADMRND